MSSDLLRAITTADRRTLIDRALRLEALSIGWMTVEAVVALASGLAAGSLTLTVFGIDSLIELASACVLIWRLTVELRHGQDFSETIERRASRIAGALLFALAAYIVLASAWRLWTGAAQAFSWPGLAVALLAIPVMHLLARGKLDLATRLGSRALRADAVESLTCFWLSLVVVAGLICNLVFGAWWIDAVTSLGILWFVVREAREAWAGEACCAD
jgi:divalent metal cation (Fe/Co/Zn/Cd) transporter